MALEAKTRARLFVLLFVVVVVGGMAVLLRLLGKQRNDARVVKSLPQPTVTASPSPATSETPTPPATPETAASPDSPSPEQTPSQGNVANITEPSYVGKLNLIIPVPGVKPDQLIDTFTAARSEGRVHDAIDIPAPAGTPVLAVADGEIVKLFQSERGGTTIYQLSADRKLIYYYAHLQRYADGVVEAKAVKQGDVIAYVGDTGNAGPGNFHLHFSISIVADPKRYWDGTNINPYPLLRH